MRAELWQLVLLAGLLCGFAPVVAVSDAVAATDATARAGAVAPEVVPGDAARIAAQCRAASRRECRQRSLRAKCAWSSALESCERMPRVFFIGNSFTQGGTSLPSVLAQLAKSGKRKMRVARQTKNGALLYQHVQRGGVERARGFIKNPGDFVVLQEQSQVFSLPKSQWMSYSLDAVQSFQDMCASESAQCLLFLTWGYLNGDFYHYPAGQDSYDAMQDRLGSGYNGVAQMTGAIVCPAGEVWREVYHYLKEHGGEARQLYRSDNKHNSALGHYVVACAMYACIFDASPVGLGFRPGGVSPELAATIQQFAANVVLGN
mmetsp:Transcript_14435/g.40882  ORF Transcript_14435/g.40882 Transcript_14435/m.40882 type:complete len:318 (-) Transcript_14435:191-1144(-)